MINSVVIFFIIPANNEKKNVEEDLISIWFSFQL